MKKYPLILKPVMKDYLWGGRRLIDEYGFESEKNIAAEGWMLSCHKDGTNTVVNGPLAGKSLDEALCLLGEKKPQETFPLLIKLIDACDRLSVQVHPEDEYAYRVEGEPGKTEMWYIVDCEEGATLAYGFNRELEKDEYQKRIENNTLDEVINYVPVKPGDVFFIKAGTLHAIGAGILIAEIQQNSNTTYRVSDYGRLGADGKPRELHIDKALDVTALTCPDLPYGGVGEVKEHSFGKIRTLAECEYFTVKSIDLEGAFGINSPKFAALLVLDGEITLNYEEDFITLRKGDSVYIPSSCPVMVSGKGKLIISRQ